MRHTTVGILVSLFLASQALHGMDRAEMERISAIISANFQEGEQLYREERDAEALAKLRLNFAFEESVRQIEDSGLLDDFKSNGAYFDYLNSCLYAGRASVALDDPTNALLYFSAVQKRVPQWLPIYKSIADVHSTMGNVDAQIETWELCIACFTKPEYGQFSQLAWVPAEPYERIQMLCLYDRDEPARVIECGEKALWIVDEKRVLPIMHAGLASLRTGDVKKAVQFYARAVESASPNNRYLFGQGLEILKERYTEREGTKVDIIAPYILWVLAECAGDAAVADAQARAAASDPRVMERVQAIAEAAQLDCGGCYSVARFLASARQAAAAVTWLGRATNGAPDLAVLRIESDPCLASLRGSTDYKKAFGTAKETVVTPEYYDAVEQASDYEIVIQDRHHKEITGTAMSPDGRFIITSSGDRKVKMWTPDGVLLKSYKSDRGLSCVAYSPTGRFFVAGTEEGSLRLWTVDGREEKKLTGAAYPLTLITVSPNGRYIAATSQIMGGDANFAVDLWSRDGRHLRSFTGHMRIVEKIAFSPDSQYVGSLDRDGQIRLWDVVSGQCMTVIAPKDEDEESSLQSFAFTRTGDGLYVWENPRGLKLLGLHGEAIRSVIAAPDTVADLHLSVDGATFLVLCADGTLRTWSAEGKPGNAITFAGESVEDAFFTPDGQEIAVRTMKNKTSESSIRFYDRDGTPLRSFPISSPILVHADMSQDGSHAVSIDADGAIRLWRTDGKLLKTFSDLTGKLDSARFNGKGDRIVVSDHGNNRLGELNVNASIWDLNGRLLKLFGTWYGASASIRTLESGMQRDRDAQFFPDDDRILLGGSSSVYTYDVTGKNMGKSIPRDVWDSSISADGERIALVGRDFGEAWTSSGTLLRSFPIQEDNFSTTVAISPDGRLVAFGSDRGLLVYAMTGALAWQREAGAETITDVCWSGDGMSIAACSEDATISLWTSSGALVKTLRGHRDSVRGVKFARNDRLLFSYSDDSTMGIWNLESGEHHFIASSGEEWIAFTDDGYFDCSRNGGPIVAVVKGFTAYGIDQFALAKNRPEVYLSRTGLGSREQIAHYAAQFRKRLAKIAPLPATIPSAFFEQKILPSASAPAVKTALLAAYAKAAGSYALKGSPSYAERLSLVSLPAFASLMEDSLGQGVIVPRVTITGSQRSGSRLSLALRMRDPSGSLYRYNLYVNDVPVFGSIGKEVKGADASVRETIELAPGTNKVEAVCLNTRLVESYRDRLFIEGPAGAAGNLYVVTFGVSLYKDEKLNLNYAHKDAEDLERLFASMEGKRFGRVFTKVIVNEKATVANVTSAKAFLKDARVADTVVLFIAGHGVHDTDGAATYYYLTHEADIKDLSRSAATFETLEDMLQDIAPRSKLFLMDTCESGEIDDTIQEALPAIGGSRGITARTVKGVARGMFVSPSGETVSRDYLNDRDRFVYNDLTRRSGAIVFSSCKGGEVSFETDERRNGLFTASILDVLTGRSGDVPADATISSQVLSRLVSEGVAKESDNLQHPTVDRDNLTQKLYFPVLGAGAAASSKAARAQDLMVPVKGGELTMGSNRGPADHQPEHKVFLDGFLISACEVTVQEFREFIEDTGYTTTNEDWKAKSGSRQTPTWSDSLFASDPLLPVIGISWEDAARFCNWLSLTRGYSPCYVIKESGEAAPDLSKNGFRLPTEAEWQFAASGGLESKGCRYSGSNLLSEVGWYTLNSEYRTHPVMKLKPNELGLYDMSGNAFEWCNDWYDPKGYTDATYKNPQGPATGRDHVLRGGCWSAKAELANVNARDARPFWDMQPCVGFRLGRNKE